jgi:hypothetical protein
MLFVFELNMDDGDEERDDGDTDTDEESEDKFETEHVDDIGDGGK